MADLALDALLPRQLSFRRALAAALCYFGVAEKRAESRG